ncbi:MAG TPA: radical SAM family heme chaperone HemW [Longimicrobium sp.]|nr:radical SAM family heme chaperone HemW [Longimicrobium sp.]
MSAARFGIYIHFPYCLSKCPYCDFASTVAKRIPEERYTDAIKSELALRAAEARFEGREVHSIFLGGGTPSLWAPERVGEVLAALRERVPLAKDAEVTLEANPGASDAERFAGFREAGINRLSIGVQSFQPSTLQALGRSHDGDMAERAFRAARAAGFDNVSMDFIYGVHGQTLEQVKADAERAASLGSEHLSAYALTLEREALAEEVPLAKQLSRGEVMLPPDDTVVEMQRAVSAIYARHGLRRYEISNYAKPGYHSRHNTLYWTGGEYLALGSGATGYLRTPGGAFRYANHRSAEAYLKAVEEGAVPEASREPLTSRELFEERLAMGLRLTSGVDLEAVCREFGEALAPRAPKVERLVGGGLARREGSRLVLTEAGTDLHSAISAELM